MAVISTSMIVTSAAVAVLSYFFINIVTFFVKLRQISKAVDQFPQDPKHWLLGHLKGFPGFNEAGLAWLREKAKRHPRYSAVFRTFLMPAVTVRHPETVKLVLKRSDPKPTRKGFYKFGRPWLGEGLLLANGPKWARNRKLITPAFHFDILRPYLVVDNEACEQLLDKMGRYSKSGESMEFYSNLSLCTLDILMRCAFSYQNDIQVKGESHPYVQSVGKLAEIWVRRTSSLVGQFDAIWNWTTDAKEFYAACDYVHSLAASIIRNRKNTLAEQGAPARRAKSKYMDFLDILLTCRDENGLGLTELEIREEVDNFLLGGHDTTASSITWTLYELAKNQEIQDKCREEVDDVLAGREDDVIEWDDQSKFKYVTMCIKEAQRLHTVVPFVGRELKEDLTIDGMTLPAGTDVEVQFYTLHHNPQVWENSMVYDPDRFLPENISQKHPYAFVPFSAGPRNCIGQNFSMQEQRVIIPRILRRFRLEIDPDFTLEKAVGIVTRPKDGLKMKIIAR